MTVYNTINNISKRTCTELEGLKISQLESSYVTHDANITISPSHVNTTNYNTFSKIVRRTHGELDGLKIWIIENSYRTSIVTTALLIKKVIKHYSIKLKLIKQYITKLKR